MDFWISYGLKTDGQSTMTASYKGRKKKKKSVEALHTQTSQLEILSKTDIAALSLTS